MGRVILLLSFVLHFLASAQCHDFRGYIHQSRKGSVAIYLGQGQILNFTFTDPNYTPNFPLGTSVYGTAFLTPEKIEITKDSIDIPSRIVASNRYLLRINKTKDKLRCLKLNEK